MSTVEEAACSFMTAAAAAAATRARAISAAASGLSLLADSSGGAAFLRRCRARMSRSTADAAACSCAAHSTGSIGDDAGALGCGGLLDGSEGWSRCEPHSCAKSLSTCREREFAHVREESCGSGCTVAR